MLYFLIIRTKNSSSFIRKISGCFLVCSQCTAPTKFSNIVFHQLDTQSFLNADAAVSNKLQIFLPLWKLRQQQNKDDMWRFSRPCQESYLLWKASICLLYNNLASMSTVLYKRYHLLSNVMYSVDCNYRQDSLQIIFLE